MLDAFRNLTQGWIAKAIFGLIIVIFALIGTDTFLLEAGNTVSVAKVDGDKISIQEYSNALRNVRDRMQSEGQVPDAAMLESTEFKDSVLDGLITRRLVNAEIARAKFSITDAQLNEYILGMPQFQKEGKFSEETYQKLLQENEQSVSKFEAGIRNDLVMQQARDGLAKLSLAPKAKVEQALQFEHQQREVTTAEIKVAEFIAQVKVTPEQVKAYYTLHKAKFIVPEQVKLEFGLLSAAGLMSQVTVSDAEVKEAFDANPAQFQGSEKRHASHILIASEEKDSDAAKAAAKQKATDILAQLKKNPKMFEELAIKNSADPGSAAKGGDLGSFARGAMVKPFEDAVFSMKPKQISELVKSDFGYHIIRLEDIEGESTSFDSVKANIKAEMIFQKAQAKYAELTEEFSNIVYEQSGSLQPVAKKFGLQLQTSPWMSREDGAKFFKSDKLMTSVFSNEVLKEKRNSEAVEVSANNLVAARVLEYKPAAPRNFDDIKGGIEAVLKLEQGAKLAKEKGEATLAKLKAGNADDTLDWITPVTIDRKNAQGLSDEVMKSAFKINTSKLPAYAGFADANRAYVLVQIMRVENALEEDEAAKKVAQAELENAVASEYISAYAKSLKAKADISVNRRLLENNAQ